MSIKTFYFNPIRVCTYVLQEDEASDGIRRCVVVDCGCYTEREQERLRQYIEQEHLTPVAHILTHGHLDHIFGADFIYKTYGLVPYLHPQDEYLYHRLRSQAAAFGIDWADDAPTDYQPISDGQMLDFGFVQLKVIHTPGHTPGGVCYLLPDSKRGINMTSLHSVDTCYLFSGDTLFQGGYGRTDLPGGDYVELLHSLQHLMTLTPETIVYPGHGYPTTIKNEAL